MIRLRAARIAFATVGSLLGLLGLLAILAFVAFPGAVRAASPIYVSTDGDDTACNGLVNAAYSPAAAPDCALATIQEGVYTVDPGGTVIVEAGTYTLGVTIDRDVTVRGASASATIVDGQMARRGFYVGSGNYATIDRLTIRNCVSPFGGGIDNRGNLTVTNSVIAGNTAPGDGDGAGLFNLGGTLLISNTTVISNTAGRDGGGIASLGDLTIVDSDILSNTAEDGAGIYHIEGSLSVHNARIQGNRAFDASAKGGGIFNGAEVSLTRVTLSGNTAIYTRTVNDGGGGAIHTQESMTLTNCTISGNHAGWGGAISNSGDHLVIASTSLVSNTVTPGSSGPGGINNYGTITVANTILAHNDGANCVNNATLVSAGHNLDSGNTCGFAVIGDLINTDPLVAPLHKNGGCPTASGQSPQTHALIGGSPAIDAGSDVDCPATDQRGVDRPVDGDLDKLATCDIGAYEFEPYDVYLPLVARQ